MFFLIGGGHTHALFLQRLKASSHPFTLISPSRWTAYSGMLPGLIGGHYQKEETHIDLKLLCQKKHIPFIQDEVISLDPHQKILTLKSGKKLSLTGASFNTGSTSPVTLLGAKDYAVPVKPIDQFLESLKKPFYKAIIIGGGDAGVEVAFWLKERFHKPVTLLHRPSAFLSSQNPRANRIIQKLFKQSEIQFRLNSTVTSLGPEGAILADGSLVPADLILLINGASPLPWVKEVLPVDSKGFIQVASTLQVQNFPFLFAAGDIASLPKPRPKAGVFAVRQAPLLAHNILAFLEKRPLKSFQPQKNYLVLIGTANKKALALRGPWVFYGHFWWWLKDFIDRRFMRRFT